MNPLGRFFVCKLSATATVFSISPLWANEESGNDKQMNNNNVPINNVSMCQYANVPMGCAMKKDVPYGGDWILYFFYSFILPFFISSFSHWHIDTLANYSLFLQFRLSVGLIVPV